MDPKSPPGGKDVPMYTVSAVNFQATAWVLRVAFGEVGAAEGGVLPEEVYRLVVGIPWPLVKVIHQAFGMAIKSYEAQEGTISVPKTIADRLAAQIAEQETQKH